MLVMILLGACARCDGVQFLMASLFIFRYIRSPSKKILIQMMNLKREQNMRDITNQQMPMKLVLFVLIQ